ncbi:MAG: hypothetical protein JJU19_06260, partial [Pararhodobacter sp.]|nr:hypothetical protein [Pararhodobacter sp.]
MHALRPPDLMRHAGTVAAAGRPMTGPQALNAPLAGGGGDLAWTLAAGLQTASVTGAGGACGLPADSRQPAGQEPSGTQPPPVAARAP